MNKQKLLCWGVIIIIIFISFTVISLYSKTKSDSIDKTGIELSVSHENYLTISGSNIYVEIADTPEKRRLGLSGLSQLKDGEGLIFIFDSEDVHPTFWMKDMLIPIDIIWINDGKIVQINEKVPPPEKNTTDSHLVRYQTMLPIDYVLEVNAGFCEKNNIKVGETVYFNLN